ncbi:MAG: phosphatase PAP2 family protein [Pirellulaceae bacterium]
MHGSVNDAPDRRAGSADRPTARLASPPAGGRPLWFAIWILGFPLLFLLTLTVVFRLTNADVAISGLFYGGANEAWPWRKSEPWTTLYHYGPVPGLVLGIAGAVIALLGLFWSRLGSWREMGLFLVLLLAIGPGLVINGIFKPLWMRPRPQQVGAFGGDYVFVSVWDFGPPEASKSFPCGHASMGFFLMGPAFLLYRRRRSWAILFLLLGLVAGALLGLARMAQGQHFLSDVIWSGGMVYLAGVILSYLFRLVEDARSKDRMETTRPVILSLDGQNDPEMPTREPDDVGRRHAA